ncbi:hypothetical protein KGF54_003092 [Candida jiufengensis]|uniref:uncharacterized protein n=1 Tax=Candida jiufengensis TaxID=497108 RepID=UPI002224609C|nr:uncharacterized protein KGF54_003092 [Candida jiufengensis]KAI5952226.1 hypothetical protein KGF54_003092 [Candida jiufengensis]
MDHNYKSWFNPTEDELKLPPSLKFKFDTDKWRKLTDEAFKDIFRLSEPIYFRGDNPKTQNKKTRNGFEERSVKKTRVESKSTKANDELANIGQLTAKSTKTVEATRLDLQLNTERNTTLKSDSDTTLKSSFTFISKKRKASSDNIEDNVKKSNKIAAPNCKS